MTAHYKTPSGFERSTIASMFGSLKTSHNVFIRISDLHLRIPGVFFDVCALICDLFELQKAACM